MRPSLISGCPSLARSEAIRLTQAAFDAAGVSAPLPTYRVDGLPALTDPRPAPARPAPPPPVAAPVQDVEATEEKELEKIVDQERAELARDDLLRENAQEE